MMLASEFMAGPAGYQNWEQDVAPGPSPVTSHGAVVGTVAWASGMVGRLNPRERPPGREEREIATAKTISSLIDEILRNFLRTPFGVSTFKRLSPAGGCCKSLASSGYSENTRTFQIGRASCRERVYISGCAGALYGKW